MIYIVKTVLYLLLFMAGAGIFSFLNVVVYRLPKKISYVTGRSHCPACDATLRWYDMVPVFNWFYLRGKCRDCGAHISFRYPAVEALGGTLALLCVYRFGMGAEAVAAFAFLAVLTVVALIDADTMEIPNGLVIGIIIVAAVAWACGLEPAWRDRLIGLVCVSLPMLLITLAIPGAFGGGDVKLMAASGLFLGWKMTLVATFLAIVAGGLYGIWLLATRRKGKKEHFAFGPFLCAGMAAALFWGAPLLEWYLGLYRF